MEYCCEDCPRRCGAKRGETGTGFCRMGAAPVLARAALHFDEEPAISGTRGSGAVFFSGCAMKCVFCQNFPVSHEGYGRPVSVDALRGVYRELIRQGAHNINLVNPTHFAHAIDQSLDGTLPVPVVWNTSGYERVSTLARFAGRVQVYLPDFKYADPALARKYSGAADYPQVAVRAIAEMLRQTGNVELDEAGVIRRGTIIRHLILPGETENSKRVLRMIAESFPGAWISLMAQYMPCGLVSDTRFPEINRCVTQAEYDEVVDFMLSLGLEDGYCQELESADGKFIPAFDLTGVPGANEK